MLKNRLTKTYPARLDPAEILDMADDDTIGMSFAKMPVSDDDADEESVPDLEPDAITPNPGEVLGCDELLPGQWDFKLEGDTYEHRAHLDYTLELRRTVWVLCRQGEPWGKLYGNDLDDLLEQSAKLVWDEEDTETDIARVGWDQE